MGLTTATTKHILLLLNFIFTVLALILIGFGIFILVSGADNKVDHGENLAGGLIIALGIIILVISIFGCIAAIHESKRKLIVYICILVVIILIQLAMAGMASQGTRDGLSGSVKEGFDTLWKIEEGSVHENTDALAYYEDWLQCCGVNNTDDYRRIKHAIPKTCCVAHNCSVASNIYTLGCQEKFEEYLAGKMLMFSIVSWFMIIAEIIGAVFAWMLYSSIKNQSRRANVGWM
ncbi:tetraspanin-9 [Teleopsis dalmanni]|uniref:tetraspanin-9 n=1 Tax=Teleopsis dalmanni TaxID=139649 RepID=UPI0018CF453A|nr:tetraspanin-9 [Teleopsis dalmanni]